MEPFKVIAKVAKDGKVTLRNLPFDEGVEVEVIIAERVDWSRPCPTEKNPLKGSVIQYDRPFDPVFEDDEWEMDTCADPFPNIISLK